MICTMEALSTPSTGCNNPERYIEANIQYVGETVTGQPQMSPPETAWKTGRSFTSSLMAVAPLSSCSEEDQTNRMAQVIQRFARHRVLSSGCRMANCEMEKRNSIAHPSLLWYNEDGSVATRRISSITMTDLEDSSGSHHFVQVGMKSNTIMCHNPSHGSKNTSSASSGHMSSLSEMSSYFGDFRFDADEKKACTEPMNDGPLQMPTRAGSMSTISSRSYSTLTTHTTLPHGLVHLPTTAEEDDSTSTESGGNKGKNENPNTEKPLKYAGSWDGFEAMPARRFIPPAPAKSLGDSPLQKPRRKSSFIIKRE